MKKLILSLLLVGAFHYGDAQSVRNNNAEARNAKKISFEKNEKIFLLTYFRQRYPTRIEIDSAGKTVEVPLPDPMLEAKLHLALSKDGRQWTSLNDNKPVWDQFMRDPYISRGPDGTWRLLATGGGGVNDPKKFGPSCLYATSKDLINWKVEASLPLMKDVRNDSSKLLARNIWAPEFFYDSKSKEYLLFWSSSFEDAGWKKSRLWYCRTKDWKTFSPATVLFDPGYSVIDGTIQEHNGKFYLYHKEEEFGAKTGERRAIRVAVSDRIDGAYKLIDGHLNNGQIVPVITEGPSIMKDPFKPGWLLLYDYCMTNRFGASYSTDLISWSVQDNVEFPADARHGSVSVITAAEAQQLLNAFK